MDSIDVNHLKCPHTLLKLNSRFEDLPFPWLHHMTFLLAPPVPLGKMTKIEFQRPGRNVCWEILGSRIILPIQFWESDVKWNLFEIIR